ncbi:hypothetical protein OsI_30480 [Oryza sativa Indica Group]|uniref:Retrotransposon protein, putative, unclassified n=1 Tax=Oryza sativa subsp. indica TaxID=39946 RepID=B8BD66_ORYSI|nr:hypothetical protein OsI_30480 [Oryza sativa Indica Group]
MAGGAQGHGDDDDPGTVLSGASGQQPGARERSNIQIGHGDELLGAPGCFIGEKSTWTAACSKWRLQRRGFGRIQGRRRLRRALNFLFHTDLSTETNKTRREISTGGSGSGGDAFERRRSPAAVACGRRLRRQQWRRPTRSDTTSQPPLLDSALAALDDASRAVTDTVRTSFIPFENVDVDPATATAVANVTATCATKAAYDALYTAVAAFIAPTSSDVVTLHFGIYLDVVTLHFGVHLNVVGYRHHVAADHDLASSVPGVFVCRRPSSQRSCGMRLLQPGCHARPVSRPAPAPSRSAPAPSCAAPAPAVSVLNVKALVPINLDVNAANFTRWRGLFLVTVGKYDLTDHVLSDAHHPANLSWLQMDCVVLGWLYGTISVDLLQEVMAHDATARSVWRALELQFLGNNEQRALNLNVEFRTFHQGHLSVNDYCRRMKAMADSLADLGDPVTDRGLILATLNGLSAKFQNLKTIITMQRPFPSFADVRS